MAVKNRLRTTRRWSQAVKRQNNRQNDESRINASRRIDSSTRYRASVYTKLSLRLYHYGGKRHLVSMFLNLLKLILTIIHWNKSCRWSSDLFTPDNWFPKSSLKTLPTVQTPAIFRRCQNYLDSYQKYSEPSDDVPAFRFLQLRPLLDCRSMCQDNQYKLKWTRTTVPISDLCKQNSS